MGDSLSHLDDLLVAVVYFHSRLLLNFRTVFVEIKLLSLLYY